MKRRSVLVAAGSVALVLCLTACSGLKGFGVSPWPLYRALPQQPELTDKEKKAIAAKLTDEQIERLKALSESEAYYRTIVVEHNKAAIEQRVKVQKALGTPDDEIDAYRKVWQAKIAPVE